MMYMKRRKELSTQSDTQQIPVKEQPGKIKHRAVLVRFSGAAIPAVDHMIRTVNFTAWVNEFAICASKHIAETMGIATKEAVRTMLTRMSQDFQVEASSKK